MSIQALKPRMDELKAKYESDPETLQLETARLYKAAGVNPLAGCLPTLATIPVFIGLYRWGQEWACYIQTTIHAPDPIRTQIIESSILSCCCQIAAVAMPLELYHASCMCMNYLGDSSVVVMDARHHWLSCHRKGPSRS
jgi:YidC/Oxa1 family membrane protein insertase